MREYQSERHGLELTFRSLLSDQRRTGRFPITVKNDAQYRLYAFAATIVRIYEQLSVPGNVRLRGMLLDGLKPDNNLLSLQHEINTAVHFVSRGFDLDFNDIEKGSGVDFIARYDGIELEVECKMFTGDLGDSSSSPPIRIVPEFGLASFGLCSPTHVVGGVDSRGDGDKTTVASAARAPRLCIARAP